MSDLVKLLLGENSAVLYGTYQRRRKSAINRLVQHTKRSTNGRLLRLGERLVEFRQMAQDRPKLIEEVEATIDRFVDQLQTEGLDEGLVRAIEQDLSEKISALHEGNPSCMGYLPDAECEKTHQKFVNAFEKKMKVDVYRWEGITEGLYIWLDPEDHETVSREVDKLKQLCADQDYLLLSQGVPTQCGPFGSNHVKWTFIWSERTDQQEYQEL